MEVGSSKEGFRGETPLEVVRNDETPIPQDETDAYLSAVAEAGGVALVRLRPDKEVEDDEWPIEPESIAEAADPEWQRWAREEKARRAAEAARDSTI